MSLTDSRVALITGAAQGIGKAIAIRLASDGFKVALSDLPSKKEQLEAVALEIDQKHPGLGTFVAACRCIPGRASEGNGRIRLAKALGGLDVMVANAGIGGAYKPIIDLSVEEFEQVLRVNLLGVFLCYKYGAKAIIASGRPGGRIIGASSFAGKQGIESLGHYSASKFGVRGLTQSAAMELGQYGITVNAYAPGAILTPLSESIITSGNLSKVVPGLPSFAKVGEPEDIASIVSYLASKEAHYITGQTISVNGGVFFD
ncbi:NAD(P)-binding protein [Gymnopus androsaceus JB14]|uniref:NAD(P)-binding protein n=1 Tax=Gymnopus androsaceus JB14 TaxID=1447944 RepID=A0A6A4HZL9_9AGAR|nr:NAD(P)-binding protein [Gymnopus androsaceus JB14]